MVVSPAKYGNDQTWQCINDGRMKTSIYRGFPIAMLMTGKSSHLYSGHILMSKNPIGVGYRHECRQGVLLSGRPFTLWCLPQTSPCTPRTKKTCIGDIYEPERFESVCFQSLMTFILPFLHLYKYSWPTAFKWNDPSSSRNKSNCVIIIIGNWVVY